MSIRCVGDMFDYLGSAAHNLKTVLAESRDTSGDIEIWNEGVIHHNDAKIQLLDLPGIIEGAAEGKGAL